MAITGLTASPSSGNAGTTKVTVTCPANEGRHSRRQALTLTSNQGGQTATVNADQLGDSGFREVTQWKISGSAQATPSKTAINAGTIGNSGGTIEIIGRSNLGLLCSGLEFTQVLGKPTLTANGASVNITNPIPNDPGRTGPYPFTLTFQVPANTGLSRVLRIIVRRDSQYGGGASIGPDLVVGTSTPGPPYNGTGYLSTGEPGTDTPSTSSKDYIFDIAQNDGYSLSANKSTLNFEAAGGSGSFDVTTVGTGWTAS
jgi:hypothetical protein